MDQNDEMLTARRNAVALPVVKGRARASNSAVLGLEI